MSNTPPSPSSPPPGLHSSGPGRRITDTTDPSSTVIGAATRVRGDLSAEGPVDVQGAIEGTCRVKGLCRVRAGASVAGSVSASSLVIEGEVTGETLEADKVEIGASARVRADVRAPKVAIADGGFFEGHVHMDEAGPSSQPTRFKEKRQPPSE